jgi:hypothetical protein
MNKAHETHEMNSGAMDLKMWRVDELASHRTHVGRIEVFGEVQ